MRHSIILAFITMRAGNDKIAQIVCASTRNRNYVVNVIYAISFCTTIITFTVLAIVLKLNCSSTVIRASSWMIVFYIVLSASKIIMPFFTMSIMRFAGRTARTLTITGASNTVAFIVRVVKIFLATGTYFHSVFPSLSFILMLTGGETNHFSGATLANSEYCTARMVV